MADTNNKRRIVICGKGGGGSSTVTWDDIQDKPNFATVATTGDYDDLTDKPTILTQWFGTQAEYDLIDPKDPNTVYNIEGSDNVQPDWNQTDTTADDYIKNKPTIPAAPVQSNWNESDSTSLAYIQNKPTIPAAQVNADWNANSGVSQILNKPTIPTVPAMTTETLTFTLQGGTTVTLNVYVDPMPNYFYVQDISGSDNTLSISQPEGTSPVFDVFGSTDRVNWINIGNTGDGITATIPANGKLYLKATTSGWSISGAWTYNAITASGNHNIGGNIMSLLNGDNFEGTTLNPSVTNNLQYLFTNDTTLVSAEELILPTNVVDGCYSGMFSYCTSLTTAPALPATTLAENCYSGMFDGCTSLTTSPVLPAATLTFGCYQNMFSGCSSLNTITTYAEGEAPDALMSWVDGVAASGDFYNLGNYQYYESGVNGIPDGWTEHTSL